MTLSIQRHIFETAGDHRNEGKRRGSPTSAPRATWTGGKITSHTPYPPHPPSDSTLRLCSQRIPTVYAPFALGREISFASANIVCTYIFKCVKCCRCSALILTPTLLLSRNGGCCKLLLILVPLCRILLQGLRCSHGCSDACMSARTPQFRDAEELKVRAKAC